MSRPQVAQRRGRTTTPAAGRSARMRSWPVPEHRRSAGGTARHRSGTAPAVDQQDAGRALQEHGGAALVGRSVHGTGARVGRRADRHPPQQPVRPQVDDVDVPVAGFGDTQPLPVIDGEAAGAAQRSVVSGRTRRLGRLAGGVELVNGEPPVKRVGDVSMTPPVEAESRRGSCPGALPVRRRFLGPVQLNAAGRQQRGPDVVAARPLVEVREQADAPVAVHQQISRGSGAVVIPGATPSGAAG